MTTRFDNMTTKQVHALLNELREQNEIPVLRHPKNRDAMITEIVKLSPVQAKRHSDVAQFCREHGIDAKIARAALRRDELNAPYDINDERVMSVLIAVRDRKQAKINA